MKFDNYSNNLASLVEIWKYIRFYGIWWLLNRKVHNSIEKRGFF